MRYARFTRDDFAEYLSWFADAELSRRLGPMDEAWLEHVLADTAGVQLRFFVEGALVAVTGIALPPTPAEPHAITDLAVRPGHTRRGIGRQVITRILSAEEFAEALEWRAYVDPDNEAAQGLLAALGWVRLIAPGEEERMLTYRYVNARPLRAS